MVFFSFQFVTSPKCQLILDEVVYHEWPMWQSKGLAVKTLRLLFHYLFIISLGVIIYLPLRLILKGCLCCKSSDQERCWKLRRLFELPYSKFINQTMSYSVFLCLVFASTFQSKFITDGTGMSNIGKSLLLLILEWWPVTAYCLMPSYKMAWNKCLISAQHIIIKAYSLQQHNYYVLAIQGTGFLQSANQNLFNVFRTSKILFFLGGFRAILNEIKANAALNLLYRCSINLLKNLDILIEIT